MLRGKKVLIVEDSPTVRHQVRLILEQEGVILVEAANEFGMYNTIDEYGKKADLIIMDLTLKSENGLDLVAKLKASERYRDIPVVMLTDHSESSNVMKARELGVSGYLLKPIQKDLLLDRLRKVLGIGL